MCKLEQPIYVTRPSLPPLDEFTEYLKDIWESGILTNGGPYHQLLEQKLCEFLGVKHISLFANGTLALITAIRALGLSGEVITTPFSFVATTHALWWNGIKPVFVDIEPETCNLDPLRIEAAITPETTAILPVHVYGNPCNVYEIQKIADHHGLKVIYDAAHAFGVEYHGQSICNFGDLSVLSFHATKVFNTMEGGAIVCNDLAHKQQIDYLKNFGFAGETNVVSIGINSKMNEMQAVLGLLQLNHHSKNIAIRKQISEVYRYELDGIKGLRLLNHSSDTDYNYAYFPIFVDEFEYGMSRNSIYEILRDNKIFCRRYFYPLISDFNMYKDFDSATENNLLVSKQLTNEVICVPIYVGLTNSEIMQVCKILKKHSSSSV